MATQYTNINKIIKQMYLQDTLENKKKLEMCLLSSLKVSDQVKKKVPEPKPFWLHKLFNTKKYKQWYDDNYYCYYPIKMGVNNESKGKLD